MPKTTLQGNILRQATKYDFMLADFALLVASEQNKAVRTSAAKFHDDLNTIEAADFLNSQSVSNPTGPFEQAAQLFTWKFEGGQRPSWLAHVPDTDLATLDEA